MNNQPLNPLPQASPETLYQSFMSQINTALKQHEIFQNSENPEIVLFGLLVYTVCGFNAYSNEVVTGLYRLFLQNQLANLPSTATASYQDQLNNTMQRFSKIPLDKNNPTLTFQKLTKASSDLMQLPPTSIPFVFSFIQTGNTSTLKAQAEPQAEPKVQPQVQPQITPTPARNTAIATSPSSLPPTTAPNAPLTQTQQAFYQYFNILATETLKHQENPAFSASNKAGGLGNLFALFFYASTTIFRISNRSLDAFYRYYVDFLNAQFSTLLDAEIAYSASEHTISLLSRIKYDKAESEEDFFKKLVIATPFQALASTDSNIPILVPALQSLMTTIENELNTTLLSTCENEVRTAIAMPAFFKVAPAVGPANGLLGAVFVLSIFTVFLEFINVILCLISSNPNVLMLGISSFCMAIALIYALFLITKNRKLARYIYIAISLIRIFLYFYYSSLGYARSLLYIINSIGILFYFLTSERVKKTLRL